MAKNKKKRAPAPKPDPKSSATAKQQAFIHAYLTSFDATKAAIAAGYSRRSAVAQASQQLHNPKVSNEITRLMTLKLKKIDVTTDHVIAEIARLGFSNMADYIEVQPDGSAAINLLKLSREQTAAIQEITVDEYTEGRGEDARQVKRVKFKLADKKGPLELLGKHLKLFAERIEVTQVDPYANRSIEDKLFYANNGRWPEDVPSGTHVGSA
jgi:phage terminase small subunit